MAASLGMITTAGSTRHPPHDNQGRARNITLWSLIADRLAMDQKIDRLSDVGCVVADALEVLQVSGERVIAS